MVLSKSFEASNSSDLVLMLKSPKDWLSWPQEVLDFYLKTCEVSSQNVEFLSFRDQFFDSSSMSGASFCC